MPEKLKVCSPHTPEAASTYIAELQSQEAQMRVPDLFSVDRPCQVYRQSRNGFDIVVYHDEPSNQMDLTVPEQLAAASYPFAQYLDPRTGKGTPFFDHETVWRYKMQAEANFFNVGDFHTFVGKDGQIVGYLGVATPLTSDPQILFGEMCADGYIGKVYDDPYEEFPGILTTPAIKVRELRRFVTRQTLPAKEQAIIGLELCIALAKLSHEYQSEIDVIIADTDPSIMRNNIQGVIGTPITIAENKIPDPRRLDRPYDQLLAPRYSNQTVRPVAFSMHDLTKYSPSRVSTLESLLSGTGGIKSALRTVIRYYRKQPDILSSLEPEG